MDYENFIRKRITQLRLKNNMTAYELSLSLPKNCSYIFTITSGKGLPSLQEFLRLCKTLDITPSEFFQTEKSSADMAEIKSSLMHLSKENLDVVLDAVQKLDQGTGKAGIANTER